MPKQSEAFPSSAHFCLAPAQQTKQQEKKNLLAVTDSMMTPINTLE